MDWERIVLFSVSPKERHKNPVNSMFMGFFIFTVKSWCLLGDSRRVWVGVLFSKPHGAHMVSITIIPCKIDNEYPAGLNSSTACEIPRTVYYSIIKCKWSNRVVYNFYDHRAIVRASTAGHSTGRSKERTAKCRFPSTCPFLFDGNGDRIIGISDWRCGRIPGARVFSLKADSGYGIPCVFRIVAARTRESNQECQDKEWSI